MSDTKKKQDADSSKKKKNRPKYTQEYDLENNKYEKSVYTNRELSWLQFNMRVLEEAKREESPLGEKLSFVSIYQSNLDEFFMVRVGSLEDEKLLEDDRRENKTLMTPQEQIDAVLKKVKKINREKDRVYAELIKEVEAQGIRLVSFQDMDSDQQKSMTAYFKREVLPLLSVMIVGRRQPFPFINGGEIYAMAILNKNNKKGKEKIGIIPCNSRLIPRMIPVKGLEGAYILREELILHFVNEIFDEYDVVQKSVMRVTRSADIDINRAYDEELSYRDQMSEIIKLRKRLAPVRLEFTRNISRVMVRKMCKYLDLEQSHVLFSRSPLDLSFMSDIQDMLKGKPGMFFEKRVPQPSPNIDVSMPVIPQIMDHDLLLFYPYESIRPFLKLLQEAAVDPNVLSIRMTLYRLASNSKVVEALCDAAENGKQVEVLVELQARFDEKNNIDWSRTLEDSGCHVVYGVEGYKVHSKLCLITMKDGDKFKYITQVGTGNYNEKTSRLYTDLSYITSSRKIGEEARAVLQDTLIGNKVKDTKHLLVAPKMLQKPVLDMMDKEIKLAKEGEPAYIGVKMNSLTDKKIINKLVEASMAGVKIEMVIRGICCLKPGIKDRTENIKIRSIVGRYLEHARIYIFGTPDRDKIYISSADFMTRNTLRRVEVAAPINDDVLKERVRHIFNIMMKDNVLARRQGADGIYRRKRHVDNPLNSQEYFLNEAYEAAKNAKSEGQ